MRSDSFRPRKTLPLGLLLLTLPLLAGCLRSRVTQHLKYNAEDDSFEVLSVFNHIEALSTDELDHVRALYAARSNLIYPTSPINVFVHPAWIRKSDSQYIEQNLGAASDGTPKTKKTEIPLDSITVKPGSFFFNKNGMPAYYHKMVVPGKAFDRALAGVSRSINEGAAKSIKEELKRRAEGHPLQTWEDVRREISKEPSEEERKTEAGNFWLNVLNERSLALLAEAAAASELKLIRHRTRFQITFPLSPADAKEAAATAELGKRQFLDVAKKEKTSPEAAAVVKSIRAEVADSGKLTLSIDLGNLLSEGTAEPDFSPGNPVPLDNAAVVNGLKERGISFDEKLTHEGIVKEFLATKQKSRESRQK